MRKTIYILLLMFCVNISLSAHGDGNVHIKDIYYVLPLERSTKLTQDWIGMISSDLIDNYHGNACTEFQGMNLEDYLNKAFGFKFAPGNHRLFFHWPYEADPWNSAIENAIRHYEWYADKDKLKLFRTALETDNARRKKRALEGTASVFGLSTSGNERKLATSLAAIVYDIHLLGDWVPGPDNHRFVGLPLISDIAKDMIKAIRTIDSESGKELIKFLNDYTDESYYVRDGKVKIDSSRPRAAEIMTYLQFRLPIFLVTANGGQLCQKFQNKGLTLCFSNESEAWDYYKTHPERFSYLDACKNPKVIILISRLKGFIPYLKQAIINMAA